MSDRLPIANCGDGVSVNVKAARVGDELYGLLCPDFRCSAHSVDGCWKGIARSETVSVNEVNTLYESLKPVVKHFKLSSKSKELLENCKPPCEELSRIGWCHLIVVRRASIRLTLEHDYFYCVYITVFDI